MSPAACLVRARVLRAYDHADTLTLLGEDGALRRFSGDSAELARAILAFVVAPRTPDALAAHLSDLAGTPVTLTGTVAETLAHLEAAGAVHAVHAGPPPPPAPRPAVHAPSAPSPARPLRVVLGLTGAVAATFMPALVQRLHTLGFEVRVAATPNALRFVSALSLEALTHAPVISALWPDDPRAPVPHIDLARWADVMAVCPASATSIARLAAGSCDTVVSAAAIATRAPVLVVPSMNDAMYLSPSMRRNLAQLRDDGFYLAHPATGIEVADAPPDRIPMIGPAPPVDALADLIQAVARHHAEPLAPAPSPPLTWDDTYRTLPPEHLPWFTDTLDPDLASLLDAPPAGGRLLDLGTGPGTAAIAAADRGWFVVATDISPHAIALARRRAAARPIVWMIDDILSTHLRGAFDLVLDRGLCHVLPIAHHPAYAAAVRDLTRPGGRLLLKCHAHVEAEPEPEGHGTRRFTPADVTALFGASFDLERLDDTTLPGPAGRAPKALLCVLRRR